jgi:dihydropteroate synthase
VNVAPLGFQSERAVRDALRSHGWEEGLAETAAHGLHPLAFHLTGLDQGALEALVRFAGTLGLEVLTGDTWAVLAGPRSRLSAFARPWTVPVPLAEIANLVGTMLPGERPTVWRTARASIPLDRPVLVGILNVTPDSFSDGGRFTSPDEALVQTERLLAAGAAMIDVGGESTRPGRSEDVSMEEELRRVIPVIEALVHAFPSLLISVDTVKSGVARAAIAAGAAVVNDVSAFRLDRDMPAAVASSGAGVVLMHSRGTILEIASYQHADYGGDLLGAVVAELGSSLAVAADAGVPPEAIVIDPGFGFSKTVEQNILLFDQLAGLQALGRPVLVGPSRKRFLGEVAGAPVDDRDRVTAVACALAYERGARLFRVHAVAAAREALALAQALGGP